MTNSIRVPNKLINEKSPYLLQHAYNPVDWWPWCDEAFAKARREDKPIFLSIGYSTCHWCHVMAHESFEDTQIGELLNNNYICIKIDREERPDVDAVYMTVCQSFTGSGGWPLTVIMTYEQKPFWAGTYLPKTKRYNIIGLTELLTIVMQQWNTNRENLISTGDKMVALLNHQEQSELQLSEPNREVILEAVDIFSKSYDSLWGGFGEAPKFPTAHNLLFLLRYSILEHNKAVQDMAEHTLNQMYRGGIFDHIGGGFSRYSTDKKWLVPHFEKMLYDNALLAYTYLEAYHMTHQTFYSMIAKRILNYTIRELMDEQGGFYCGQDADSEGVEGKFYVFTTKEIQQNLGESDCLIFCDWFDITAGGNFEGQNIPNLIPNSNYENEPPEIAGFRKTMYDYRQERTKLHKDCKILTSWNALMIAALAKGSWILEKPMYLEAAKMAEQFIAEQLIDENDRLLLRWCDGEAAHPGHLDDYAFYAFSLLELYRTTFHIGYLQEAIYIAKKMLELFKDEINGGFFLNAIDSEQLITRPKEVYDGALPSGNSIAANVLGTLAKLTGESMWIEASHDQLRFVTSSMKSYPAGHSVALIALMGTCYPSQELICTTSGQEAPAELLSLLRKNLAVNLNILVKTSENQQQLAQIAPFTASYPIPESDSMYYLCQNDACSSPVQTVEELQKLLDS